MRVSSAFQIVGKALFQLGNGSAGERSLLGTTGEKQSLSGPHRDPGTGLHHRAWSRCPSLTLGHLGFRLFPKAADPRFARP